MTTAFERLAFEYGKRRAKSGHTRTLPPLDLLFALAPSITPTEETLGITAQVDKAFQMGYDSEPRREKEQ